MTTMEDMGRAYLRHSKMATRHRQAARRFRLRLRYDWGVYEYNLKRAQHHEGRADYHDAVFN